MGFVVANSPIVSKVYRTDTERIPKLYQKNTKTIPQGGVFITKNLSYFLSYYHNFIILLMVKNGQKRTSKSKDKNPATVEIARLFKWQGQKDLNPRPTVLETAAPYFKTVAPQ